MYFIKKGFKGSSEEGLVICAATFFLCKQILKLQIFCTKKSPAFLQGSCRHFGGFFILN